MEVQSPLNTAHKEINYAEKYDLPRIANTAPKEVEGNVFTISLCM